MAKENTEAAPPTETDHDPLDRVIRLAAEIETHKDRMAQLLDALDPTEPTELTKVVVAIKAELLDTVMSLLTDFATAASEAMLDEREYITDEIAGRLEDLETADDDEDDDSVLTDEDAAEYTALLSGYRVLLGERLLTADDDGKIETNAWIARVDKALKRTAEITEEPDDEPEEPTA